MDNIYKADLSTFYLFEGVIYRLSKIIVCIVKNRMRTVLLLTRKNNYWHRVLLNWLFSSIHRRFGRQMFLDYIFSLVGTIWIIRSLYLRCFCFVFRYLSSSKKKIKVKYLLKSWRMENYGKLQANGLQSKIWVLIRMVMVIASIPLSFIHLFLLDYGKSSTATTIEGVSQAFNTVWHKGLTYKLNKLLPASANYCQLLEVYISVRKFRVKD